MTDEQQYIFIQKSLLSRKVIRIFTVIGLIPMLGLIPLDYYAYPELGTKFLFVRLATGGAFFITCVLCDILCRISDVKHYLIYAEITTLLTACYVPSMIAIMVYYTGGIESNYFVGFFVIAAFFVIFFYLRLYAAFLGIIILMVIYSVPLLIYSDLDNYKILVINIVLLISALLVVYGWTYIIKNIHEQRLALEYRINKNKENLEQTVKARTTQLLQSQKMESMGIFAAGLAHDFNNILSSIKTFTDFMLFRDDLSEDDIKNYQIIDAELRKGSRIVDRLMSMGKSSSIERIDVDINDLIVSMMDVVIKALPSGINIQHALANNIPNIKADKTLIQQAINNLIINARDAMGDNGDIYVATGVADKESDNAIYRVGFEGRYVRISIADNGPGIPNELLGNVFDPFVTSKEQGIGTGLGLSMVYIIAHDHSGFVDVESTEGKGTTFNIYLPVK